MKSYVLKVRKVKVNPELSQDSNLELLMSKSTQSDYQRIVMMMTMRRKKNIIYFLNPRP